MLLRKVTGTYLRLAECMCMLVPSVTGLGLSAATPVSWHAVRLVCWQQQASAPRQVLGLYKPLVWEYARLNITNNLLSKRRLARLVADGHVSGWDDPRLLTLAGLRRRGVAPEVTH